MPAQEAGSSDARRDLQRHIGQTVRKLRLQQNLTIVEIARKAQISSGMLSKIENSQTSASLDTLASLAEALGTTLASLFTGFSSEEGGAQHVKSGHATRGRTPRHQARTYLSSAGDRARSAPSLRAVPRHAQQQERNLSRLRASGHRIHLPAAGAIALSPWQVELPAGARRCADVPRQRAARSGKAHQAADQDARDHHLRRRDGAARDLNIVPGRS